MDKGELFTQEKTEGYTDKELREFNEEFVKRWDEGEWDEGEWDEAKKQFSDEVARRI